MKKKRGISSVISNDKSLSDFEKSVYRVILNIPQGQTRSYKWVAQKLSRPGAARAVGNALNKNPYAPMVPCHRVVKSDGAIGGYAKGIRAKRRMLKTEGIDWI